MTAVRLATAADLRAIAHLHCASFPESLATQLGGTWVAAEYRRKCASGAYGLYVADPPSAGFLGVWMKPAAPRGARPWVAAARDLLVSGRLMPWGLAAARLAVASRQGGGPPVPDGAWIDYIAIAPEQRGRGLGAALVRRALDDLPDERWAVTTTTDNTAALALYRRFGFVPGIEWSAYDGRRYVRLELPAKHPVGRAR